MTDTPNERTCTICQASVMDIPLITLEYRHTTLRICPKHMPQLIHEPAQLIGSLPGAEKLSPADHRD